MFTPTDALENLRSEIIEMAAVGYSVQEIAAKLKESLGLKQVPMSRLRKILKEAAASPEPPPAAEEAPAEPEPIESAEEEVEETEDETQQEAAEISPLPPTAEEEEVTDADSDGTGISESGGSRRGGTGGAEP